MIKLEEVTFGHLTELNGKFKMRATEFTFAPGAYLGAHHHIGPGVRYILSGELTFTEGGVATVYKAGDYYFETGNLAHTAENKTDQPLRILIVEIFRKTGRVLQSFRLVPNEPVAEAYGPLMTQSGHQTGTSRCPLLGKPEPRNILPVSPRRVLQWILADPSI